MGVGSYRGVVELLFGLEEFGWKFREILDRGRLKTSGVKSDEGRNVKCEVVVD